MCNCSKNHQFVSKILFISVRFPLLDFQRRLPLLGFRIISVSFRISLVLDLVSDSTKSGDDDGRE